MGLILQIIVKTPPFLCKQEKMNWIVFQLALLGQIFQFLVHYELSWCYIPSEFAKNIVMQ